MAQVSETTLRLDILRAARDRYAGCRDMRACTGAERTLYGLKIAECEAMIRELLAPAPCWPDPREEPGNRT